MSILSPVLRPVLGPVVRRVTDAPISTWANMVPAATRYVSQTATNDYAAGADAGAGSTKDAPWLTLDYAIANSVSGDVIHVNDGEYAAATFHNVTNKSLTIVARSPLAVTITAADAQTRIFNINLSSSMTLALWGLVLDGRNNTTRGISIGGATVALGVVAGLTMRRCTIKDCTTRYIESISQKSLAIDLSDLAIQGAINGRPLFFPSIQEGTVAIRGVSASVVNSGGSTALIEVGRAAGSTGPTVEISSVSGSHASAAASATIYGILVRNVEAPKIESCNIGVSGGGTGALYWVRSDVAGLPADGSIIRNNRGHLDCDDGYAVIIGTDGSGLGDGQHNNPLVENNTITANASSTLPIHGLMLGWGSGGTVQNNTIDGAGHALLAKDWTGGTFSGNTASNFSSDGIYAKAAAGTVFTGNTLNATVANTGGVVRVDWDDVSGVYSTDIEVSDNIINIDVNPPAVVNVDAGNDVAFSGNTYNINAELGASPAPWEYQGTGYLTLEEWKAVEPTALP